MTSSETEMKPFQEQTYYELLEVAPTASTEEIEKAYARLCEQFSPDSVAIYSLAEPEQAEALLAQLKRAVQTLSDPDLRRGYDQAIGIEAAEKVPSFTSRGELKPSEAVHSTHPDVPVSYVADRAQGQGKGMPRRAAHLSSAPHLAQESAIGEAEAALAKVSAHASAKTREAVKMKPPEIPDGAEFNGELLRRIREARGMTLQFMAERTRITRMHLENVEADRYDALPATVYLRGILMNIARELMLDPLKVSKSYLELVAAKK
jgi:curved DNA-binding protein CbpA